VSGLVGQADARQLLLGARLGVGLAHAAYRAQAFHDVAQGRHMREEVELLEHHADTLAHQRQLGLAAADLLAVERDRTGIGHLHEVEATQQGRLA
jgi:hypothetical protein